MKKIKMIVGIGMTVLAILLGGCGQRNDENAVEELDPLPILTVAVSSYTGTTTSTTETTSKSANTTTTSTASVTVETDSTTTYFVETTVKYVDTEDFGQEFVYTTTICVDESYVDAYTNVDSNATGSYIVEPGDTLLGIAEKFFCSTIDLVNCNPTVDWNYIYPGDVIIIPSSEEMYYDEYNSNSYTEWNYENYDTNYEEVEDYSNVISYTSDNSYVLSSITIPTQPDYASWYNICLALDQLNGLTLAPGDVFNWETVLGANSKDQGYMDAPVYEGEQVVYGEGGGVCVASTALFQAARAAGMTILERHDHSMPVGYASPGDEAAVSYGSANLIFQNDTYGTVYFTTSYSYGEITVSCYTY